ncbi:MAG: GH3 family domain-containing protein [Myxococcales bacterium]
MGHLALCAVQAAYAATLGPAARRFARAVRDPAAAQARRLRLLVGANAATAYGRAHGFAAATSIAAFQDRVPIVGYDELEPWIERVARGEPGVLTAEPVRVLEPSSGSTARNKLIPYTAGLLDEISAGTHAWLLDLYQRCPGLRGTVSYWSISPATRRPSRTEGGIPIGFDDDTSYFNPLLAWALRQTLAVPPTVAHLPSATMDAWRWETARYLLDAAALGLISVWSPTFLSLLMRFVAEHFDALVTTLPAARAARLRAAVAREGRVTGEALWPQLALLSCWTDGASGQFMAELRRWFPRTSIQPKGLLATEGVVSIPLIGVEGAVAAVAGHFLEFLDLEHAARRPLLAHQLREGGAYSPLLTTSGGLYRYHLKDVVRCVGRYRATPTLRFEGRLDCTSDLCGEKLEERRVAEALARAAARTGLGWQFALVAPSLGGTPGYCLFVESDADAATLASTAALLDEDLATSHHYGYCRALGQLAPLRAVRVRDGWATFQRVLGAAGARCGDIKPTLLDRRTGWAEAFAVDPRDPARPVAPSPPPPPTEVRPS